MFMVNAIDYEQFSYMTNELKKKIDSFKNKLDELQLKYKSVSFINKDNISRSISEHWQYLTNREKLFFLTEFVEEIIVINHSKIKTNNDVEILDVKFYNNSN